MDNSTEKPQYKYWVDPKKEGPTEVQAITVFDGEGRHVGMTQKWKGVTALEMVKDYVEVSTDLVWPEFDLAALLTAHVMPPDLMEELKGVLAYMEEDEHADYHEQVRLQGEGSQKGHVWLSILKLTTWLEGK